MKKIGPGIVSAIAGIIGLAIVAVIVSKNAQTAGVITGAGTALSSVISAAVSPVSAGGNTNQFGATPNLGNLG
jgi:preprotein translocase subunit SecD